MNWMDAVLSAKKAGAVYPGDQQQKGTTMSKYIDLAELITDEIGGYQTEHSVTLNWLDRLAAEHPDQVPGRTITESEFKWAIDAQYGEVPIDVDEMRSFAACLGLTIVPDPEPTNADKLGGILRRYDLDAITGDGAEEFARQLDADGVKAPGGDDA